MLEITFFDSEMLRDGARFAAANARVSAARRAKVEAIKADAPRRLSLAAGLLLADTLASLGVAGVMAEDDADALGKPWLPRCPELHFSLSHSGTRAMCAVADRPVGCDIQLVTPRTLRIAQRFFSAAEQDRIFSQATEAARQDMFYRIWTMKESFVKCLGLGLELPLESFTVYPENNGEIVLVQDADPGGFRLTEPEGPEGYRCAVCVRE